MSQLKVITSDEILIVSNQIFHQVHSRLIEIFDCKTDKSVAGILIIVCNGLYQLIPVKAVPVCVLKNDRLETLVSYNVSCIFSLTELTEVIRQKGDL